MRAVVGVVSGGVPKLRATGVGVLVRLLVMAVVETMFFAGALAIVVSVHVAVMVVATVDMNIAVLSFCLLMLLYLRLWFGIGIRLCHTYQQTCQKKKKNDVEFDAHCCSCLSIDCLYSDQKQ